MIEIRPEPQTLLFSYKNESRESRNTRDKIDRNSIKLVVMPHYKVSSGMLVIVVNVFSILGYTDFSIPKNFIQIVL